MKTKTFTILILLISAYAHSQSPNFQWSKQMGGLSSDVASQTFIDRAGNMISAGLLNDTADFDPSPAVVNLIPEANQNLFISKVDASGNSVWAGQIADSCSGCILDLGAITGDDSGNVYVSGFFLGLVDLDPGPNIVRPFPDGFGNFVIKVNPSGNLIWAANVVLPGEGNLGSLAVDASGNVYGSGNYWDGSMVHDVAAKFDASGNSLWNGTPPNTVIEMTLGKIKTDPAGFIYGTLGPLKVDSNQNILWAGSISGNAIAVDDSANVYSVGSFSGTVDFDPSGGNTDLVSAGFTDIYVTKMDSSGNLVWARNMGGANDDYGFSIAVDDSGNVYSQGSYSGTADFDPGLPNYPLTGGLNFISKLDMNGNFVWAIPTNSTGDAVGVDNAANVYSMGTFTGTLDFDPGAGINDMTSAGFEDVFLLKLDQQACTPTSSSITQSGCDSITINSQTYSSSGQYTQTLTNAAGCDSTITLNLTITTIDISVTFGPDSLAAIASGVAYQWIDCDNGFILVPNETNQVFYPAVNGNYAVIITENSCTDTSFCYDVIGVGIEESIDPNSITAYPNPTNDLVYIKSVKFLNDATVRVFDVTGKIVVEKRNQVGTIHSLDLTQFPSGIYSIEIQQGEMMIRMSIMKN